jgi:hypothetical protein
MYSYVLISCYIDVYVTKEYLQKASNINTHIHTYTHTHTYTCTCTHTDWDGDQSFEIRDIWVAIENRYANCLSVSVCMSS